MSHRVWSAAVFAIAFYVAPISNATDDEIKQPEIASNSASAEKTTPDSDSSIPPYIRRQQSLNELAKQRGAQKNVVQAVFKGPDGKTFITNRPEKYRGMPNYKEIRILSDPVLPKLRSMSDYFSPELVAAIQSAAAERNVDPHLIAAMVRTLSGGNASSGSKNGAAGLMMLTPVTAKEMGVEDVFDSAQNISGGTKYIAKLLKNFNGDTSLALAAYVAGPANIRKDMRVPDSGYAHNFVLYVLHWQRAFEAAEQADSN